MKLSEERLEYLAYFEIRPRLGSVNAHIKNFPGKNVTISPSGDKVSLWHEEKGLELHWPKVKYGSISPGSIHNLSFDESLSFRFNLKGCHLSLLDASKIRRKLIKPCYLSQDFTKGLQSVFCAKCGFCVAKPNIERLLPLPSGDWRGGINDWFCACSHAKEASCDGESGEKIANKKLHEKNLGPRESDLLYAHSQILLHSKYFSSASHSGQKSSDCKIRCQSCQSNLGDQDEKDDFVQLWHHSVILKDEVLPTALETFLLLIGGVCADHDWLPLKIRLKTSKNQLFIWMLDPNLKVLKICSGNSEPEELSLMKVMHSSESHELGADQELSVPDDVMAAGMGHLQENSLMIPLGQRRDSNFHISYIGLDAVLLK